MKRLLIVAAFAVAFAALGRQARAQALNDVETVTPSGFNGNGGGQTRVVFAGQLQQAVQLTLVGVPDGSVNTTIAGAGTAGVVDFGVLSTQCAWPLANGACIRITSGIPGGHLVASFRATVAFSAAPSADLGISRHGPIGSAPPDVLNPRLRFALGLGTAWTNSNDGQNMPLALQAIGENNLGAVIPSGTAIVHQVAIRFADSAQQASYSTTVRWTATIN